MKKFHIVQSLLLSTHFASDGRKLLEMDYRNLIACAVVKGGSRENPSAAHA